MHILIEFQLTLIGLALEKIEKEEINSNAKPKQANHKIK